MNSRKCLTTMMANVSVMGLFVLFVSGVVGQDKIDFVKQIKPILEEYCVSCHGGDDYEEFQIDIRDEAFNYLEAGSSEESQIFEVLITDDEDLIMPPADEEHPLTPDQIELIRRWIDEGAEWPDDLVLADTAGDSDPDEETASTAGEQKVDEESGPEPAQKSTPQVGDTSQESRIDPKSDAGKSETPAKKQKPEVDPKTEQIFNSIGSLHPAAIHLPIGLLLGAGFFALLSLRGNFVMSDCAYYCLWLGTIGAVVGCATGWWFSPMEGRGTVAGWQDVIDQSQPVFWHRTWGLIATGFAFLLAVFAAGARNRDPDNGVAWKLGVILLAGGIGWVGHTGGELHYPKNHYKDLNNLFNSFFEMKNDVSNGAPDTDSSKDGTSNPGADGEKMEATQDTPVSENDADADGDDSSSEDGDDEDG